MLKPFRSVVFASALLYIFCLAIDLSNAKEDEEASEELPRLKGKSKKSDSEVEKEILKKTKNSTTSEDGMLTIPINHKGQELEEGLQDLASLFGLAPKSVKDLRIKYLLFTQKNKKTGDAITYDTPIEDTHWNTSSNTVFLVHGFALTTENNPSTTLAMKPVVNIKNAYMQSSRHENVIIVDWSTLPMQLNYLQGHKYITILGEAITAMIVSLKQRQFLKYPQVKLVGFSLGAHIAGASGAFFSEKFHRKLSQITGLDPAGIGFDQRPNVKNRLDKSDADFVDVIHTNMGADGKHLGSTLNSGHVDFYPSGGMNQPGCEEKDIPYGKCSHTRAAQLYASTVRGREFRGCECENYEKFKEGECTPCKGPFLGDLCSKDSKGKYYLKALPEEEDAYEV